MWHKLGHFVLRNRILLLLAVLASTLLMGYFASQVKMSYEFAKAIPTDHPQYAAYLQFKKQFGDDGNTLVVGVQTPRFFEASFFKAYTELSRSLKKVNGVQDVLCIPSAVNLIKDAATGKFRSVPLFDYPIADQNRIDSSKKVLDSLRFYHTLLFNPDSMAYLMAIRVDPALLNSVKRTQLIKDITQLTSAFESQQKIEFHLSGLPLIRTLIANRIAAEMKWFLLASLLLAAVIIFLFFQSFSTTLLSMAVVITGVVWSFGILYLLGYKITLLTALTPPLIVVITVPNCIYFINKYHTAFREKREQHQALVQMVEKMGIVTLFCNITAAIGFAVFALTKSPVLKEFGEVAGISIMAVFVVSLIVLPSVLFYLPEPASKHMRYIDNRWLNRILVKIETWVLHHRLSVYGATAVIILFSLAGILKLKSVGYIVDDLPKNDKIYTDLRWFEKQFKGVMPLEILVDTRKKYGLASGAALIHLEKIDRFSDSLKQISGLNRPLSITEGLKFVEQAFYDGDPNSYHLPSAYDFVFLSSYLRSKTDSQYKKSALSKISASFIDSNRQVARISINMADVGSRDLPIILNRIRGISEQVFDSTRYKVTITGTAVTFLEGSRFIINGLTESILWAFLLIALCMIYLFRSMRILLCSLIPNLIPLVFTAGVMGWAGIALKPSTVLVFSVALGIAIDVTIRFLINYKQELPTHDARVEPTIRSTIRQTGISIIYTSLVLVAGFFIFIFSSFGGTQALGWLTSLTLLVATLTNLILLPVLLFSLKTK